MLMSKFEERIQEIVAREHEEEARAIIQDLNILYEQFHALSRRLIYLLTGEEKTRTGLTDFVKATLHQYGAMCQKELMRHVTERFDPTITSKAVSDSLQYLMETRFLENFWDAEIKKRKYRIPRKKRK